MKSKPHVTVQLGHQTVRCYQVASRRLQRLLGAKAPSTSELLRWQLARKMSRKEAVDRASSQRRLAA